jgi:serine/threonine-protein kinase
MKPEPGSVVGGKYRLERALAAGGMGSVWVARDLRLEIQVAVKFMAEAIAAAPSAANRFEREAKAAAQLKSPHVVHIYDYGVEDGTAYIAMELLEGEDLDTVLTREKRLSLPRAAELLGQAAKALRAAHEAHIVHRDIKPANLFLARSGDDTVLKILDFGIAKETQLAPERRGPTTTGAILGSPLYMSPEQARGSTVTERSDLWSLAVVAFEMVTGCQPFLGASVGDVIAKICGDELPIASRFAPDLRPEVDAFFTRALARDPAARFPSARALAASFAELAALPDAAPAPLPGPGRLAETGELPPPPAQPRLDDTVPALVTRAAEPPPAALPPPERAIVAATALRAPSSPALPRPRWKAALPAGLAVVGLSLAGLYALRPPPSDPLPLAPASASAPASSPPALAPSASSTPAPIASPDVLPTAPSAALSASARPAVSPPPPPPLPSARPSAAPKPSVDPIFGLPAPK